MAVGPSAAPMMPMEAASLSGNPSAEARIMEMKIPPCPAAPMKISHGLEMSGPKSIMAPIPMKRRSGNASALSIPTLYSHCRIALS